MTFYLIAWNGSRCQLDILKAKENQELRKSGKDRALAEASFLS